VQSPIARSLVHRSFVNDDVELCGSLRHHLLFVLAALWSLQRAHLVLLKVCSFGLAYVILSFGQSVLLIKVAGCVLDLSQRGLHRVAYVARQRRAGHSFFGSLCLSWLWQTCAVFISLSGCCESQRSYQGSC